MIVETVVDLFFSLLTVALQGLEAVHLPMQLINTLSTITAYGTWIVGIDILGIFITMIVTWWVIKWSVGVVVFLWELLPLT